MNTDKQIILIADNIRSLHNVGSIFRTADAFAVNELIFTGVSPTPRRENETRLPHVIEKAEKAISKVALGAERTVQFNYFPSTIEAIGYCRQNNSAIIAIEQSKNSKQLDPSEFDNIQKLTMVIGTETTGLDQATIDKCDKVLELPMLGKKESLNASVMTGIALFCARLANL